MELPQELELSTSKDKHQEWACEETQNILYYIINLKI